MKNEGFKEGIDFYFDESGLMVLTKDSHLKRGFCCGNGCRHCPYNHENVAEIGEKNRHQNLRTKKINHQKNNLPK